MVNQCYQQNDQKITPTATTITIISNIYNLNIEMIQINIKSNNLLIDIIKSIDKP